MTEGLTMIDAYVCGRVGKLCVCCVCSGVEGKEEGEGRGVGVE